MMPVPTIQEIRDRLGKPDIMATAREKDIVCSYYTDHPQWFISACVVEHNSDIGDFLKATVEGLRLQQLAQARGR